jgi:hypothetical protein
MSKPSRHSQTRLRAVAARGAVLAACGMLAAACGSAAAPAGQGTQAGGPTGAPSPAATPSATASTGPDGSASPAPAAPAQVNLSITLAGSEHWTIRCEPASGSIPDPGNACRRLLGQPDIFAPTSHHVMCPQVMTDAPPFLVTGSFRGVPIHDTIVAGGCSLSKWAALHAIVQPGTQVGPAGINPGGPDVSAPSGRLSARG